MKALILNSGLGRRMGVLTSEHPKCMTEISSVETIVSRQLRLLADFGIREVVMTTGSFHQVLEEYCSGLSLPLQITYVHNPRFAETNYIYSIFCARELLRGEELVLLHGDLVFESRVLEQLLGCPESCMAVSSAVPLPEKDFKAVIADGRIQAVDIHRFDSALAAQPLYHLYPEQTDLWLESIERYVARGETSCYAENALNDITDRCRILPADVGSLLCAEIDNPEDLARVTEALRQVENRRVYMCFSTDMVHAGHIAIIRRARRLGKLMIGVLSDEAVASYRRFPLLCFEDRKAMFESLAGVEQVVEQKTLSYRENLEKYRPDFVVHGDDWRTGFQQPVREEVQRLLAQWGGQLVEYPYTEDSRFQALERRARSELSLPDLRRGRLRKLLEMKHFVTALEAHSGITGLIVENPVVHQAGGARQFDAMWISSLCDSTARGKPDIELVDMTSRFRTVDDILEVTTKPIIFDGDTGGLTEHFVYTVRSLERMGVSMVIIEDKTGLKKNSLFGTQVPQTQDTVAHFCEKIRAGKAAQKSRDFMICARIESLILEAGMEDALLRARAYVAAGADAIMIHSRRKEPDEILAFLKAFRETDAATPVVLVPSSYSSVTEETLRDAGANIVIYANQLTRTGFPAMQRAARSILEHHRAQECDAECMSIQEIITLIPEDL